MRDFDFDAGHLLAIIKPKIVRHTIILSANNLFLLTAPTSPVAALRIRLPHIFRFEVSFAAKYIPRDFNTLDAVSYDISA
jgi:hypothetical protein